MTDGVLRGSLQQFPPTPASTTLNHTAAIFPHVNHHTSSHDKPVSDYDNGGVGNVMGVVKFIAERGEADLLAEYVGLGSR